MFSNKLNIEEAEFLGKKGCFRRIEIGSGGLSSDKAPGPEGLNFGVLKSIWKEIKNNMLHFVNNFFEDRSFPRGISSSSFLKEKMINSGQTVGLSV